MAICRLLLEDGSGVLAFEDASGDLLLEICLDVVAPPPGGRGIAQVLHPHRFTREKWRELVALMAAEKAARAKAQRVTTPAKKRPLVAQAEAAQAAIQAAQIEGKNAALDRLLVRNTNAIRAAIRAAEQVELLKKAATAIDISRTIAARQAEDEEDTMITLLLLS